MVFGSMLEQTRKRLLEYKDAKVDVLQENIDDVVNAAKAGYFQELLHLVGAESASILSQRFEVRRSWARGKLSGDSSPKPSLPEIRRGSLSIQ